jgi:hypothetical protein
VFDEPAIPRDGWLRGSEPMVSWFRESTRPEAVEGRRVINDLYSRFPDTTGRMVAELRSTDDRRLYSALDELFVHDLLIRHYRVGYEEGAGTRPDFRLYRGGACMGVVEVLSLFQREDWTAEQRRHDQIADAINERLPLTTHSLVLDIRRWDATPSVRHIVAWLGEAIARLQADPAAFAVGEFGTATAAYTSRAAEIVFEFIPLRAGYGVSAGDRIVVSGAATGGSIDSADRLRDRLDQKAGKYELGGKPFAIVIGAHDSWCSIEEVHQALTGTPAVVVATGEAVRHGDGFFGNGRHHPDGKRPQVSAVYSLHEWFPGGPNRPRITRFDNPFAANEFPHDVLPYTGHWGVQHRDTRRVQAGWLTTPEAPNPA